jgi:hypothetical protein
MNKDLLSIVVRAYFDDIYYYKLNSHTERADNHKQGAYMIKWLSKLRPIQILPNIDATKEILFINASFAIFVGFSFLKGDVFDTIDINFYKHLLSEVQFENFSGKNYASMLYLIEENSRQKT